MTIFNKTSVDPRTELYMISFLPPEDQVSVSGVNKKAYQVLSNDLYFKKLFENKYCPFGDGTTLLKKLTEFCNNHPNNCWKVFCCIFQTGQMNFSESFLNETFLNGKNRMKQICGNSPEDPSSPLNQARQAYKEQKRVIAQNYTEEEIQLKQVQLNDFMQQVVLNPGRLDEWRTLTMELDSQSATLETRLSVIKERFNDERVIPLVTFWGVVE